MHHLFGILALWHIGTLAHTHTHTHTYTHIHTHTHTHTHTHVPAKAASDGEQEESSRYGAAVIPVSFETYGRMEPRSMERLREVMIGLASLRRGSRGSAQQIYSNLRLSLERTLVFEIADTTLRCFGHGSALNGWRRMQALGADSDRGPNQGGRRSRHRGGGGGRGGQ